MHEVVFATPNQVTRWDAGDDPDAGHTFCSAPPRGSYVLHAALPGRFAGAISYLYRRR